MRDSSPQPRPGPENGHLRNTRHHKIPLATTGGVGSWLSLAAEVDPSVFRCAKALGLGRG